MTRPKAAILLALERSGTHLLRSIVNANAAGFALDEVANAAAAAPDNPIEFFGFQRLYRQGFPDRAVPSAANTDHMLECYLDNLELGISRERPRPVILDIKYGHVVNFAGGWWLPFTRPALFALAARRGVPIIHLVRRKVAQTAVSNIYATASGVWKARSDAERSRQRIVVPRAQLIDQVRFNREAVRLARCWAGGLDPVEMAYEDLLDPASPSWRAFAARCGAAVTRIETPFVRAIPSHAEVIANHDEIADLLDRDIDDPAWDQGSR